MKSCGYGSTYRLRTCTNPAPSANGAQCQGSDRDGVSCFTCPPATPITTIISLISEETATAERIMGKETNDVNYVVYVTVPVVVAVLCGLVGITWRRCRGRLNQHADVKENDTLELSSILSTMLMKEGDVQLKIRNLLLSRSRVEIGEVLGKGAFGIVYKGLYSPDADELPTQTVAIKSLKDHCIGSDIRGLVDEAVTMTDFDHAHVMSIIGVCIDPDEGLPMLVMPYMDNGDLNSYLRSFLYEKTDSEIPDERQLLLFCLHIARGMEYLSGLKFIHRDLAARNCMVDSQLTVKVADFGLTRDVYTSSYYRQDKQNLLPYKWMAMECLQHGLFTLRTDIWSFGVTMWEVLSLGRIPYPTMDNNDMLKQLESGRRLERPKYCPEDIYVIMRQCWQKDPDERPTFTSIIECLLSHLSGLCEYLELDIKKADRTDVTSNQPATTEVCIDNGNIYYPEGCSTHNMASFVATDIIPLSTESTKLKTNQRVTAVNDTTITSLDIDSVDVGFAQGVASLDKASIISLAMESLDQ